MTEQFKDNGFNTPLQHYIGEKQCTLLYMHINAVKNMEPTNILLAVVLFIGLLFEAGRNSVIDYVWESMPMYMMYGENNRAL